MYYAPLLFEKDYSVYREGFKNRNMARLRTLEKARGFELFLREQT